MVVSAITKDCLIGSIQLKRSRMKTSRMKPGA